MKRWSGNKAALLPVVVTLVGVALGIVLLAEKNVYTSHAITLGGRTQEVRVYHERRGIRLVTVKRDPCNNANRMDAFLLNDVGGKVRRLVIVPSKISASLVVQWDASETEARVYRAIASGALPPYVPPPLSPEQKKKCADDAAAAWMTLLLILAM